MHRDLHSFPTRRSSDLAGKHQYPSDVIRPGMLYGKILRQPTYGATLKEIDLAPAKAMEGVAVVRDGSFIRSEEHTSELQSRLHLVCRLLLEKKKRNSRA